MYTTSSTYPSGQTMVTTDQSRSLPQTPGCSFDHAPPPVNHYDYNDDDDLNNDTDLRREKHLALADYDNDNDDDDDETSPKRFNPYHHRSQHRPSSSVYISMSAALPSLHEKPGMLALEGRDGEGEGEGEGGPAVAREGGRSSGRAESVYSNTEAIERDWAAKANSNSSASHHDSHVTLGNLKEWGANT